MGLATAAVTVAAPAPGAGTPGPRWVAADAAVYLEIPRPAAILDAPARGRIEAALRALPQVDAYFRGASYQTLRTVVGLWAEQLGTTPEEAFRRLSAGGIVLAVEATPATEGGGPPRTILIVTPNEPAFARRAIDALLALARQDAARRGRPDPLRSRDYRGINGYALGKAFFALVEGSIVISDRAETIETVLDRALDGMKGGASIDEDPTWKERRGADSLAWGVARLDRLRAAAPGRFKLPDKIPAQATLLFGSWFEALRNAPWIAARLEGGDQQLAASLILPAPAGGYREALKGFVPPDGQGAPGLLSPPGTIANLSLWRDLSAIWEARAELFTPEVQLNLAKLDTFAGQFFGGRDFGSGVLGALEPRWRLVVAHQDYDALSPRPDLKLPGFALIAELDPDDDDFNQRLKVAFQSFIGLANLGAAQKAQPPFELGSETCEGVTISTARYMPTRAESGADAQKQGGSKPKGAVHQRHNFAPSIAQVENRFILSTSVQLTRALIRALRAPAAAGAVPDATLLVEVDGPALGRLVRINRDRLIMQNMLDKGHDQGTAEGEVDRFERVLTGLGHGRLTVRDRAETLRFDLSLDLSSPR